jgi:hypothetical protein
MYLFSNMAMGLAPDGQFSTGNVIMVAAGSAIVVAVVDHFIERQRRNERARQAEIFQEATPIIIRRPIDEEPDETQ